MPRVRLCAEEELEVGTVRRFEVAGTAVALVRCEGGYHAVVDNCSHEDFPLSDGEVDPELCEIECMHHGSMFSLLDGQPQTLPATRPVTVIPVVTDASGVFVEVP